VKTGPADELSAYVSNFIYAVRKKYGQEYEPNSMIQLSKFQSIQIFQRCNQYGFSANKGHVFQSKMHYNPKTKHLKSQGKGNTPNAAAAFTSDDIKKFYTEVQLIGNNSRALQISMW
jgi:hypothetical protein